MNSLDKVFQKCKELDCILRGVVCDDTGDKEPFPFGITGETDVPRVNVFFLGLVSWDNCSKTEASRFRTCIEGKLKHLMCFWVIWMIPDLFALDLE